jgi:hypothetical protein
VEDGHLNSTFTTNKEKDKLTAEVPKKTEAVTLLVNMISQKGSTTH